MKKGFLYSIAQLGVISSVIILAGCAGGAPGSPPQTTNKTAHRIYRTLPQYARAARNASQPIHAQTPIKHGMRGPQVAALRARLIQLGDLKANDATGNFFGPDLENAVRRFQWRHGLKITGTVNQKTLAALNVPLSVRYKQLHKSMSQWAKFPENEGSHYIRVNVPSYQLDVIKDGHKVMNMRVVAGKPSRPTPQIYSKVQTIVFNPKWNVPRKIARKDIIPKVIENPNYLAENNIDIYSSWKRGAYKIDPATIDWQKASRKGFKYRFTQAPGDQNALGRVKFVFLNKHDVYMHDTPQKGLFSKVQRAFSSGCIRVEQPYRLVEYFLQNNPDMDQETVQQILDKGKIKYVRIKNPVPIYVTYITAWVDANGTTHFREDVYKRASKKKKVEHVG